MRKWQQYFPRATKFSRISSDFTFVAAANFYSVVCVLHLNCTLHRSQISIAYESVHFYSGFFTQDFLFFPNVNYFEMPGFLDDAITQLDAIIAKLEAASQADRTSPANPGKMHETFGNVADVRDVHHRKKSGRHLLTLASLAHRY